MELFIRNELSVNSDLSLEQAASHSTKLLDWLLDCQDEMQMEQEQQPQQLELNYTDIECMLKATLYLFECHARYGDELVDAILLQCSQAHAAIRRYFDQCERDRTECIRQLCAHIINGTRNGHAHASLLYQMHKAYADVQPAWSVIKDLDWSALGENKASGDTLDIMATAAAASDMLQMRQLVRRIFRLGNIEDVQIALQRAMRLIGCELWLQLFRERKESIMYTRCYILRQMICDILVNATKCDSSSTAANCFVHNIYLFVAIGNNATNVCRLYRWLMHVRFAAALGGYLLGYWLEQLPHLQLDEIQLLPAQQSPPPLEEILYLTHLLLLPKSPCRSQFYAELRKLSLPLLKRLMELLNKVAYVYS